MHALAVYPLPFLIAYVPASPLLFSSRNILTWYREYILPNCYTKFLRGVVYNRVVVFRRWEYPKSRNLSIAIAMFAPSSWESSVPSEALVLKSLADFANHVLYVSLKCKCGAVHVHVVYQPRVRVILDLTAACENGTQACKRNYFADGFRISC